MLNLNSIQWQFSLSLRCIHVYVQGSRASRCILFRQHRPFVHLGACFIGERSKLKCCSRHQRYGFVVGASSLFCFPQAGPTSCQRAPVNVSAPKKSAYPSPSMTPAILEHGSLEKLIEQESRRDGVVGVSRREKEQTERK